MADRYHLRMPVEVQICPNCGSPLQMVGNRCRYCEAVLSVTPSPPPPSAPASMAPPPGLAPAHQAAGWSMMVSDVFSIKKRGTVVTGRIESGTIRVGDDVTIEGASGIRQSRCTGIEMFRKKVTSASVGDTVGLLLEGIEKDDIAQGDRLHQTG